MGASTGPRPGGRGISPRWTARLRPQTRFNGAAPRGARNCKSASSARAADTRFNGAAPRGARNSGMGRVVRGRLAGASTGPRPGGRGIHRRNSHQVHRASGFNGAAPRGARNFGGDGGNGRVLGGASTGPRPGGRGILVREVSAPSEDTASTGPRPGGRGIRACAGAGRLIRLASTGPRPGGRGIAHERVAHCAQPFRFNGAAPRGARN